MKGTYIRWIGSATRDHVNVVFRGFVDRARPRFGDNELESSWKGNTDDGTSFIVWYGIFDGEIHYAIQVTSSGEVYGTSQS